MKRLGFSWILFRLLAQVFLRTSVKEIKPKLDKRYVLCQIPFQLALAL
jgi:hypothetical protein